MLKKQRASAKVLKDLGKQIRHLRKERGLSQEALSVTCGMFRTYLSRIENGIANPSVTVLVDLSTALGVKVTDLFAE